MTTESNEERRKRIWAQHAKRHEVEEDEPLSAAELPPKPPVELKKRQTRRNGMHALFAERPTSRPSGARRGWY